MNNRLAQAIKQQAERIGADPVDFATVISFETGGTFNPWQRGPKTKWGRHVGLIQMGEPQRKKYGYTPDKSLEDLVKASADYLVDNGFKAGMGLHQMYATINTGSPYTGHRSDAKAGGTWGSANDKVDYQMRGHREKAQALMGGKGTFTPKQPPPETTLHPITLNPDLATRAPSVLSFEERLQRARVEITPYDNWFDELGASLQSFTITGNMLREASRGRVDPFWQPDEQMLADVFTKIPENYWPILTSSRSQADFESQLKIIDEDMTRTARLGEGGWSAVSAGLVAGAFDPVTWLAGGVGGKAIQAGNWGARALKGAGVGAATNMGFELGSRHFFNDPHASPLEAAAFGAAFGTLGGIMMRNPALRAEGADVQSLAIKAQSTPEPPIAASLNPSNVIDEASINANASLSAAVNPDNQLSKPLDNITNIPKELSDLINTMAGEDVATGFDLKIGSLSTRFDIAGQMNSSYLPETRLVGQNLVSDGAGMRSVDGVKPITPDSVTDIFLDSHRVLSSNYTSEYAPALRDWMKQEGVSNWQPFERATARDSFHGQITDYINEPDLVPDISPHTVKAAKAQQEVYAQVAEMGNKAGIWNVKPDPHYTPLFPNQHKIAEFDVNIPADNMHKFIEQAIIKHSPDIDPELAKAMAKGYWLKLRRAGYGIETGLERALHEGDRAKFVAELRESLEGKHQFSDDDLARAFDAIIGNNTKVDPDKTGLRHAKRRTLLDYNHQATLKAGDGTYVTLKVRQLFEQDADLNLRRYLHATLGRIALASKQFKTPDGRIILDGIKSDHDVKKLKDFLFESYRHSDRPPHIWQKEYDNQIKNIDFILARLNAVPLHETKTQFAQIIRRLGTLQFIRLMSNMGFNQLMETTRIMNQTGWRAAWSQLPSLRDLTMEALKGNAKSRNKLGQELQAFTGIGTAHLFQRNNLRMDVNRLGEPVGGKFVQAMDTLLDAGQKITTDLTLFRYIHSFQQMWAINAITQSLADMARKLKTTTGNYDFSKAKGKDIDRLATLGMDKANLEKLFNHLLDHGSFEGKRIVGANLDKWDAQTLSKFRIFLNRYTDNIVLNNDFGSLAKWMSHPLAGLVLQFRTFVTGAWSKAFLHGINHWDTKQFTLVMAELMAGAATYAIARTPMLANEESRKKYLDDLSNPLTMAAKGWSRSATASILPMLADTLLPLTGTNFRFDARASGTATGGLTSSPVSGHIDQAIKGIGGLSKALTSWQAPTQSTIRNTIQSLTPFSNWIAFNAMLSGLVSPLPTTFSSK